MYAGYTCLIDNITPLIVRGFHANRCVPSLPIYPIPKDTTTAYQWYTEATQPPYTPSRVASVSSVPLCTPVAIPPR